jgi:hypothetical protein
MPIAFRQMIQLTMKRNFILSVEFAVAILGAVTLGYHDYAQYKAQKTLRSSSERAPDSQRPPSRQLQSASPVETVRN